MIGCSLFLCYYFEYYSSVYYKLIKFYERTHNFKNKRELKNVVFFENTKNLWSLKSRWSDLQALTQLNKNSTNTKKRVFHEIDQALCYARKLQLKTRRLIASHLTFSDNMI